MNALLVEYPGYGVYKGQSSSKEICKDAETVFDFLVSEFSISPKNILLFGRSIGSGPATHLASCRNVGGLILMSPYTSLKAVVGDYAGKIAKMLISQRFENIEKISLVKCPILMIHGLLDKLISYRHSVELKSKVSENTYCELFLSLSMTHNDFDVENDLSRPLSNFLTRSKIIVRNGEKEKLKIPSECSQPSKVLFKRGNGLINRLCGKFRETR